MHIDSRGRYGRNVSCSQIGAPPKPLGSILVEWRLVGQVAQVGRDSRGGTRHPHAARNGTGRVLDVSHRRHDVSMLVVQPRLPGVTGP